MDVLLIQEEMMERDIDYVIAVAECRSISQAAEVLYISQPSLSLSLIHI
mgnify:CR=1 FL=1